VRVAALALLEVRDDPLALRLVDAPVEIGPQLPND
jgi:hypothetical protein